MPTKKKMPKNMPFMMDETMPMDAKKPMKKKPPMKKKKA